MTEKQFRNKIISIFALISLLIFSSVFGFILNQKPSILEISILSIIIIYLLIRIIKNMFAEKINTVNWFDIFLIVYLLLGSITLFFDDYNFRSNLIIYLLLAIVSFHIGTFFHTEKNLQPFKLFKPSISYLVTLKTLAIIIFYIGVFFALIYLYFNLNFILEDLENNRVTATQGNGIILHLGYLMSLSYFILCWIDSRGLKVKNLWFFIMLSSVIYIFIGYRSRIVELILFQILIMTFNSKKYVFKMVTLGTLGLLFLILYSILRTNISTNVSKTFIDSMLNMVEVGSQNFSLILSRFPYQISFMNGSTYFMNLELLLPGAGIDFTLWLKNILNLTYNGGGFTPTILGEFYINFGTYGLIFGMFTAGYFIDKVDEEIKKTQDNFILILIVFLLLRSITGGLANVLILGIYFIVVFLIMRFCSIRLPNLKKGGTI